jgi:RNA polymerase sigma-70 factor (ECF subfamily)
VPSSPSSADDPVRALVERAQRGDAAALDALLERYLPAIRAFARLQMGDWLRGREAESDLVQSACVEVLRELERFEYRDEEALRSWLFGIVRHRLLDHVKYHRAQRRDPGREVHPALSDEREAELLGMYRSFCSPSRELGAREQIEQVEAAFARLPEGYREAITLAKVVGLGQRELAEALGTTVPAARNRLHRALARLAAYLDEA